jgi:hypothetical protein
MTSGGTTTPGTTPQPDAAYPAATPPPGFPTGAPPSYPSPVPYAQQPHRGRWIVVGIGLVVAIALGAAALIVSLTKSGPTTIVEARPSSPPTNQPVDTTAADKALCQAMAPLAKEGTARDKAFVTLGRPGTPERDAGIPSYVADTIAWATRAQAVLDQHFVSQPGFLMRSFQRYVDDERAYVAGVRPGPATEADNAAWNDSSVALNGPLDVCDRLGVQLW